MPRALIPRLESRATDAPLSATRSLSWRVSPDRLKLAEPVRNRRRSTNNEQAPDSAIRRPALAADADKRRPRSGGSRARRSICPAANAGRTLPPSGGVSCTTGASDPKARALRRRLEEPPRPHCCDDAATRRYHDVPGAMSRHLGIRSADGHARDILFSCLLVRCYLRAGCRRRAFHPMRICPARTRIPCAIPRDIATMLNRFRLPRRRHLAQTHSYGVWTSSITVITGKLMRPGKVFGRLRIETARCACSSRA